MLYFESSVFQQFQKALAVVFTVLTPFLVFFGASDIAQHLHMLPLLLPSLGLKEKGEEVGV